MSPESYTDQKKKAEERANPTEIHKGELFLSNANKRKKNITPQNHKQNKQETNKTKTHPKECS